jgi:putative transposase
MPNHVHLVVTPSTSKALHRLLKAVHGQYAQRVNRMRGLKGHLWQGRYFSSALDPEYFRNAVRYVELNPVRAGLVSKAEEYPWSSAAAHCGIRRDPLAANCQRSMVLADIANWSQWLARGISHESCQALRRNSRQNLPCGSTAFVAALESLVGRQLRHKPAGRRSAIQLAAKKQAAPRQPESGSVPSEGKETLAEIGERPLLITS